MKAANVVRDCFPLPETPISIALPLGCIKIRVMAHRYFTASVKNTRLSFDEALKLKSISFS